MKFHINVQIGRTYNSVDLCKVLVMEAWLSCILHLLWLIFYRHILVYFFSLSHLFCFFNFLRVINYYDGRFQKLLTVLRRNIPDELQNLGLLRSCVTTLKPNLYVTCRVWNVYAEPDVMANENCLHRTKGNFSESSTVTYPEAPAPLTGWHARETVLRSVCMRWHLFYCAADWSVWMWAQRSCA